MIRKVRIAAWHVKELRVLMVRRRRTTLWHTPTEGIGRFAWPAADLIIGGAADAFVK